MTDWASMDNSPRNPHLARGGCAVDTSSQMAMFAEGPDRVREDLRQTRRRGPI